LQVGGCSYLQPVIGKDSVLLASLFYLPEEMKEKALIKTAFKQGMKLMLS
jgi:hypothetical protein